MRILSQRYGWERADGYNSTAVCAIRPCVVMVGDRKRAGAGSRRRSSADLGTCVCVVVVVREENAQSPAPEQHRCVHCGARGRHLLDELPEGGGLGLSPGHDPIQLQHRTQRHQSRVIGAITMDGSLQLLHRLWNPLPSCPAAAKASVFGRAAAGARGKAVSLSLTLQQHKQRHLSLAESPRERKGGQCVSGRTCRSSCALLSPSTCAPEDVENAKRRAFQEGSTRKSKMKSKMTIKKKIKRRRAPRRSRRRASRRSTRRACQ